MRLNFQKSSTRIFLIALSFFALAIFSSQIVSAASTTDPCSSTTTTDTLKKCFQTNQITKDLQLIINALSAGVGIVVIAMIILGGIQYTIAGDNAQATAAAKKRVTNALLALFTFLFIFAFLQWLVPGGLFG